MTDPASAEGLRAFRCEPCWDYIAAHHVNPDAEHRDTGSRPDSGIDADRLAEAMRQPGINWPRTWKDDDFAWVARQVAAEYARLSAPRTETSE